MSRWRKFLEENPYAPQLKTGIERQIDFGRWGFHLAYAGARPTADVILVYQSPLCRVRFGYARGRFAAREAKLGQGVEEEAFYEYGRLHAPDSEDALTIDGKKNVAWHYPPLLLNYLECRDGRASLDEVAAAPQLPFAKDRIRQEAQARGPSTWPETWASRIAVTWDLYGEHLFEVLDVRRPELWEGYRTFRKVLWEAIKKREYQTQGDRAQASIKLLSIVYDQEIA
jgi:hypothetical protein